VNVPIIDRDGRFIGVTGGGIDASQFVKVFHDYETADGIHIYMVRNDGNLIYASRRELISSSKVSVDTIWQTPVFDTLSRSRSSASGFVLEPDGPSGAILWVKYMSNWNTYLVVERSQSFIRKIQNEDDGSLPLPRRNTGSCPFVHSCLVLAPPVR
jgi:hypothetical protein